MKFSSKTTLNLNLAATLPRLNLNSLIYENKDTALEELPIKCHVSIQ